VECVDGHALAYVEAVSAGSVGRGVEVEQMAVCGAGALLEFGEQGVADARGPGGSTYNKIIDGQFAAAEGCRNDPPSGDAEAGAI
jgi:hypothetical protein